MNNNFRRYIIFWFSQALSQLGSSMTSFALILWAYTQKGTAMTISLMTFFNYIPYVIASLFAGTFVDRHSKKKIMLVSDSIAAICSVGVLALYTENALQIWSIYLVNFIIGIMEAFQEPAAIVAIGKVVPKEKLTQVSGLNSFSSNLVRVLSPVLAASLFALSSLKLILVIDLTSFLFAFSVLIFVLKIPEDLSQNTEQKSAFTGCKEGFRYLTQNHGILIVIITMALLNFFSRLTYENILSPMILSRSANDSVTLGIVNAVIGIGGIIGGIIVSTGKVKANNAKMIYMSAMLSFLLGDITMGLGRNALQVSSIPIGVLLGGYLADYVFEPYMCTESAAVRFLHILVGDGTGSGMAVMFLCTGILGALFSFIFYQRKDIRNL